MFTKIPAPYTVDFGPGSLEQLTLTYRSNLHTNVRMVGLVGIYTVYNENGETDVEVHIEHPLHDVDKAIPADEVRGEVPSATQRAELLLQWFLDENDHLY